MIVSGKGGRKPDHGYLTSVVSRKSEVTMRTAEVLRKEQNRELVDQVKEKDHKYLKNIVGVLFWVDVKSKKERLLKVPCGGSLSALRTQHVHLIKLYALSHAIVTSLPKEILKSVIWKPKKNLLRKENIPASLLDNLMTLNEVKLPKKAVRIRKRLKPYERARVASQVKGHWENVAGEKTAKSRYAGYYSHSQQLALDVKGQQVATLRRKQLALTPPK
ncbi:hypothetical protein RUM43_008123 [Polyplax serrata]|uniref:Uncharacterized protein n=1 Tax=Polyplax serrata TaxID=468196 RepID=A0AAN8PN31_POLSC